MIAVILYNLSFIAIIGIMKGSRIGVTGHTVLLMIIMISVITASAIISYETIIAELKGILLIRGHSSIQAIPVRSHVIMDSITSALLIVVTGISMAVYIYSSMYASYDSSTIEFHAKLGIFIVTMDMIALAEDIWILFAAWEIVGFTSYILISYYKSREAASLSSIKAILVNKIGDISLILLLAFMLSIGRTSSIETTAAMLVENTNNMSLQSILATMSIGDLASLAVILAVLTKSAQYGFHIWLTDAMEGPTTNEKARHPAK